MYALRTRAPVVIIEPKFNMLPLDLHVLSLPLAFILSQDQTLHSKAFLKLTYIVNHANNLDFFTTSCLILSVINITIENY